VPRTKKTVSGSAPERASEQGLEAKQGLERAPEKAQKTKKASATAKSAPTREEIALRAYHIFLERRGAPGNAFEDWTRAERELVSNTGQPRRKAAPKTQAA